MRIRALLAALIVPLALAPAARAERFAVHAAHWVDAAAGALKGPVWVLVSGDTIESVLASAPAGVAVKDLGDATLLPGLIDFHTHLSTRPGIGALANLKSSNGRNAIAGVNNCRATVLAGTPRAATWAGAGSWTSRCAKRSRTARSSARGCRRRRTRCR